MDEREPYPHQGLYPRRGNLFPIRCQAGPIYVIPEELVDACPWEERVMDHGRYYTYTFREGCEPAETSLYRNKLFITKHFAEKLREAGYAVKRRKSDYGTRYSLVYDPHAIINERHRDILHLYEGFDVRFPLIAEEIFLRIDPHVIFRVTGSLDDLMTKGIHRHILRGIPVRYREEEYAGISGYLERIDENRICHIVDFRDGQERRIQAAEVFPEARAELIRNLLVSLGSDYDVVRQIQRAAFLHTDQPSRYRLRRTLDIASDLAERIFPLSFGGFNVVLETEPVAAVPRISEEGIML